jgi:hypothetical protein
LNSVGVGNGNVMDFIEDELGIYEAGE